MATYTPGAAAAGGISTGVLWAQPHFADGTSTLSSKESNYAGADLGDASNDGRAIMVLSIPTGFTTLTKAVALGIPGTDADLRWSVATDFGTDDEQANANTDSIGNTTRAVSNADLEFIDISAAFTSIAAEDVVSVQFTREGADSEDTVSGFKLIGIFLEYT